VTDWVELISSVPTPALIATDLDDTLLLADGSLSARSISAIRRLRRNHILVVPVTARRPRDVVELFRGSEAGPLAITSNGAAIWDLDQDALVSEQPMRATRAASVVHTVRTAIPDVVLGAEHLDELTCEPPLIEVLGLSSGYRIANDLSTAMGRPLSKIICWHPEIQAGTLALKLQQAVGTAASAVVTGDRWVELLHPSANKGDALIRVCSLLGLAPEQVISVGNDANDAPMMRVAGVSLAVANSSPEILGMADGVVPANVDEGVASLLEVVLDIVAAHQPGGT
jgi:Cof subfamily protein (haloacid dehalogenase superfamily)